MNRKHALGWIVIACSVATFALLALTGAELVGSEPAAWLLVGAAVGVVNGSILAIPTTTPTLTRSPR